MTATEAVIDGIRVFLTNGYWEPTHCCDRAREHQFRVPTLEQATGLVRADHPKES